MAQEWECAWCGDDLPDCRLHLDTCSHACAQALRADNMRLAREAVKKAASKKAAKPPPAKSEKEQRDELAAAGQCIRCRKPNREPEYRHCPQCRMEALARMTRQKARELEIARPRPQPGE